jgi:hypothetical protein
MKQAGGVQECFQPPACPTKKKLCCQNGFIFNIYVLRWREPGRPAAPLDRYSGMISHAD